MEEEKDDSGIEQDHCSIYIRVAVEDHHLQKVIKFNLDETVWTAKQKVLQVLLRELPDGWNFGLYLPASNGRAGKFLDESRYLREYPFSGPVSYLDFKYKRRVYKAIHLVEKNINSKISTKRFVEWVKTNQVSKVNRCLEKGFDPNIHLPNNETPLSCACVDLLEPRSMIMALVNGGAHLDFRTRDGALTPLHHSAIHYRKQSIITLLELGASPNVFDEKGLTPLYHLILSKRTVSMSDSSFCCQLLLQDHSLVNCRDDSLCTELHQACRLGLVQHLEHLLFYRAEINAINQAGNTPLHICAATNQEACVRVLLFRGADRTLVNKSNQTADELALVSQNSCIASIIQSHQTDHVVPFRETPLINPKRRSIYIEPDRYRLRSQSLPKLPPELDKSSRSSSPKSFSDHGLGSEYASPMSSANYTYQRKRLYAATPGRKCLCVKSYQSKAEGELTLTKGEIVEILSVGEQGYLEGRSKESEGWFPSDHVQDIRVFKHSEMTDDETIVISRDALSALMINNDTFTPRTVVLQRGKKGFGFVLRGCRVVGSLFHPTPSFPALQFLDTIEKGSNADRAGLKQNDYVLEINGMNVISTPHEECVQLIKRAGDTLALKVVTAQLSSNNSSQSLPYRRKVLSSKSLKKTSVVSSDSCRTETTLILQRKEQQTILEDLDRTLAEYEFASDEFSSTSKQSLNGSSSLRSKTKPLVPERDSSLYDCFSHSYQTFRPVGRPCSSAVSVPNLTVVGDLRRNSHSSSTEADEESMNQSSDENGIGIYMTPSLSLSTTNMSTFKSSPLINALPAKPSDVKRRSNHRKQIYAALNAPPGPPPPPPPPPLPIENEPTKVVTTGDFQQQIEQAKIRLKKIEMDIEDRTPPVGFPPPPSPQTLHRSVPSLDPRLDGNFSSIIAQRAAAAKARRQDHLMDLGSPSHGFPPSTTFFNNCVTTNRIHSFLPPSNSSSCSQRFSATANQLLDNLKRRSDKTLLD